MALLNYTTTQDADKTAGEIANMLRKAGARAVLTEYDESGEYVSSLSFKMLIGEREAAFKLPCDWQPVQQVLIKQRERASKSQRKRIVTTREQSVRVAWRIVKDWVEAQLAFIETKQAKSEHLFIAYLVMSDGRTLSEQLQTNPQFLLTNK